jgi:hypothetical protein
VPKSESAWEQARLEFPELLKRLKPKNVVVLGKDMWSKMPDTDVWLTDDVQGYALPGGGVAMCWAVRHPSRGLSWAWLSSLIRHLHTQRFEG